MLNRILQVLRDFPNQSLTEGSSPSKPFLIRMTENTEVRVANYFGRVDKYWSSTVHMFILEQALSKLWVSEESIQYYSWNCDQSYISQKDAHVYIAYGNNSSRTVSSNTLKDRGFTVDKDRVKQFNKTFGLKIDCVCYREKYKELVIFIPQEFIHNNDQEIILMILIKTFLEKLNWIDYHRDDKATKLFYKLTKVYFEAYSKGTFVTNPLILSIFEEYMKDQPEYIFDLVEFFKSKSSLIKDKRLEEINSQLIAQENNINSYLQSLEDAQNRYEELILESKAIAQLEVKDSKAEALIDMKNTYPAIKELNVTDYDNGELELIIETPLHVNEPEELINILPNLRYSEFTKQVMRDAFIDERFKIWQATRVRFNPFRGTYKASSTHTKYHYIRNPHLYGFNCWGSYSATLNQLLKNMDYPMFVETVIGVCTEFNWADNPVVKKMADLIEDYMDFDDIELPNGKFVSINHLRNLWGEGGNYEAVFEEVDSADTDSNTES